MTELDTQRILWLGPKYGLTDAYKYKIKELFQLRSINLNPNLLMYINLHVKVPEMAVKKGRNWACSYDKKHEVEKYLDKYIEIFKPKLLVCNCEVLLNFFSDQVSLHLCRGSVYFYKGLPVLVIDKIDVINQVRHGVWIFVNDFQKLVRWYRGELRYQPKFTWSLCDTVEKIEQAEAWLCQSQFLSSDTETHGSFITCAGYTGNVDGKIHSWVIPFFDPSKSDGAFWHNQLHEQRAWQAVRKINDSSGIKILQNGGYDAAYFIKTHTPLRNYLLDTYHLFHSIWSESPKSLNFITSIVVDNCQYWKDDSKGIKTASLATIVRELKRYFRYNALDCYYTFLDGIWLTAYITQPQLQWAVSNYAREMRHLLGVCLKMDMRGFKLDWGRLKVKRHQLNAEYDEKLKALRVMTAEPNFNPFSNDQVASLIYDVLGAQPIKTRGRKKYGKRSVDKNVLRLIASQHPIFDIFIDAIHDAKSPRHDISNYCNIYFLNSRFYNRMNPGGTETPRFASSSHQFWIGTNAQNIPKYMRDMFVADKGKMLWELDYKSSDAYFVAYHSEDKKYISNLNSGKDVHCLHVEFFFKIAYNIVMAGLKNKEKFFAAEPTGVRHITKRITHGAAYQMRGFTLYMQMGKKAVIAAATALGHKDTHTWTERQIVNFCQFLLDGFLKLYPELVVV